MISNFWIFKTFEKKDNLDDQFALIDLTIVMGNVEKKLITFTLYQVFDMFGMFGFEREKKINFQNCFSSSHFLASEFLGENKK